MMTVDALFSDEPPEFLFHYTGVESLLGIANTRSLWASHAYYMNDSLEIKQAVQVFFKAIDTIRDSGSFSREEEEFLNSMFLWIASFRDTLHHIFVFALSEHSNLLSQWRSYTPHAKGVSIGFSGAALQAVAKANRLRIGQCKYTQDEHMAATLAVGRELLNKFSQRQGNIDLSRDGRDRKYWGFLEEFRGDVLQALALVKHGTFREEGEWRLVSEYFADYTVPEVRFRPGASLLMPYIEVPLAQAGEPMFSHVTLGPTPHGGLSMSALSAFLSNKKVCNNVLSCGIPYREW